MDLGRSLTQQFGSDGSDSVYEHTAILGRIALEEFIRRGRGIPHGMFEDGLLRFSPRMVDIFRGKGKPVHILPLGTNNPATIAIACRVVWEVFGLPVRVLRTQPLFTDAFRPSEGILDAEVVLAELKAKKFIGGAGRVVALTNIPLRSEREITDANNKGSVYGYAGLVIPVAVCSTSRLTSRDNTEELLARTIKLIVHEIAHTFGVVHCKTEYCVMNTQYGRDGRPGLDYMGHELCTVCLAKVMSDKTPHVIERGEEAQE